MSLEKIDQSEAAAEFRKALGDLANDGDDSFGESSSGESVEPVALAPKTRIEAGFRGANGIFIDFVSRNTRSKHPLVVMLLGDAKSRNLIRRRASQSEAGVKMLATYKDARAIINFESLEWKLMDLLTTFWKNQKHPAWITRRDVFQDLGRRIHLHNNMERCIEAELQEYILDLEKTKQDALQQAMVAKQDVDPTNDDPLRRIHGFWKAFHRGTRKGDPRPLTPAKTELCLPALNGSGWIQPKRLTDDLADVKIGISEQLKSARSAALSTVKSAPELRPRHRDKVPLMTSEALQEAASVELDQDRFTPPNSMRNDRKMWWYQSGLDQHRMSTARKERTMTSKYSELPHLVPLPALRGRRGLMEKEYSDHSPAPHFGSCPTGEDHVLSPSRSRRSTRSGHLPPIEHAVIPVYSGSDCNDFGDDFASPTKQYIYACQREQVFTATHLRQLSSRALVGTTIARLLPTLVGGKFSMNMAMRRVDNVSEFIKMLTLCKEFLLFNPQSPTGHYKLDLRNTSSAYVAQALALLDRWESGLAKRKDLVDISENGDFSCIRNCRYAQEPLLGSHRGLESFHEWVIPEKETLELDYVTNQRPDCHGAALDDASFKQFLIILQQAQCDGPTQIKVTRNLAHYINLTSTQMRQLLGVYQFAELREEALVTTFFRIVDIHNEKIFRVRYEEQSELDKLRARLGYCNFFAYIQPEQVTYDFDFAKYDQRLAANVFFNLANAERRDNIANFRYTLPDGTIDKLEQGVPRSWDTFSRMPKEGTFHFTYRCSPGNRKFALRKSFLSQYGKWKVDVTEDMVTWWSAANEAPEDVLEFLFWMRAKFRDTHRAFGAFDGPDGNGVIGLREFEEGMRRLKCNKFSGKDEKQRWTAIFRFLDPSGEGNVSKAEFLTLDTFWAEVEFSIFEFMDWASRTFGKDPLKKLWRALDEDGGGSIQRDEWESSLDKVGYFGPSGPIFSFIDDDDGGEISWNEFQMLKRFEPSDC